MPANEPIAVSAAPEARSPSSQRDAIADRPFLVSTRGQVASDRSAARSRARRWRRSRDLGPLADERAHPVAFARRQQGVVGGSAGQLALESADDDEQFGLHPDERSDRRHHDSAPEPADARCRAISTVARARVIRSCRAGWDSPPSGSRRSRSRSSSSASST